MVGEAEERAERGDVVRGEEEEAGTGESTGLRPATGDLDRGRKRRRRRRRTGDAEQDGKRKKKKKERGRGFHASLGRFAPFFFFSFLFFF